MAGTLWIADTDTHNLPQLAPVSGYGFCAVTVADFSEEGFLSGASLRVRAGEASDSLLADLPLPTSLAFDSDGKAYLTVTSAGEPGTVRIPVLTELAE